MERECVCADDMNAIFSVPAGRGLTIIVEMDGEENGEIWKRSCEVKDTDPDSVFSSSDSRRNRICENQSQLRYPLISSKEY